MKKDIQINFMTLVCTRTFLASSGSWSRRL
jgi:hypothetical protein